MNQLLHGPLKAIVAGDVINGMGYRMRPFEIEEGGHRPGHRAHQEVVHDALVEETLGAAGPAEGQPRVRPRSPATGPGPRRACPIIGEFWAMTTEGDGNYQLQRFPRVGGRRVRHPVRHQLAAVHAVEGRYDTKLRAELRGVDEARKSLKNVSIGKKLAGLFVADLAIRAAFHTFGACIGYRGYKLPDMDEIAETAHKFYNNNVRGGEGHMEVGKFILNVLHNKAHMTLSVKPFGCMPSSGVSDGVQSMITGLYPQSIFCAIETSGDGKVNVQSRVQMFLFKARLAAQKEYAELLDKLGLTGRAGGQTS
jgi:hypothetical protein